MGIPEEDDAIWARLMQTSLSAGDPDIAPDGIESIIQNEIPEIFARCTKMIAERRETPDRGPHSVLVHAEIDGQKLEEHEIVMGFFLLMAAGNDSTKATYCSGMRALIEHPSRCQALIEDPTLIRARSRSRCGCSRPSPTSAARRRATPNSRVRPIREGDKVVMWYVSSNRDKSRYEDPDRFDVSTQPRAPGVRCRRASLLSRDCAGAARAQGDARGDAAPLSGGSSSRASRCSWNRASSTSSSRCRSRSARANRSSRRPPDGVGQPPSPPSIQKRRPGRSS